jgi:hypothetical protein
MGMSLIVVGLASLAWVGHGATSAPDDVPDVYPSADYVYNPGLGAPNATLVGFSREELLGITCYPLGWLPVPYSNLGKLFISDLCDLKGLRDMNCLFLPVSYLIRDAPMYTPPQGDVCSYIREGSVMDFF